jgi:SAM-dependent methyltransferase
MSPPETFGDLERFGWQARAHAYDDHLGQITAGIAAEVVDGLEIGEGEALLDLFGVAHFPDADAVLAECHHMLRAGGRLAFTAWSRPEENDFFRVLLDVIDAHGRSDVSLLPAPDMYRFVDRTRCEETLSAIGFDGFGFHSCAHKWRADTRDALAAILEKSTVRAAMMMERQEPDAGLIQQTESALDRDAQQARHTAPWHRPRPRE